MMRSIALLGSTGSIGNSTLQVAAAHREEFSITGLAAGENIDLLLRQIAEWRPRIVSVAREADVSRVRQAFPGLEVHYGEQGLCAVAAAPGVDTVVAASNGTVALQAALTTLKLQRRLCLANKEVLVAAGELVMAEARRSGAEVLPVDSELSAVFQALGREKPAFIKRIVLTASGGPFLHADPEELRAVSVAQALNHPVWSMGRKISVDSATMMNKALEMVETFHLFSLRPEQVSVLIHPQGVVHSLVEYLDNSVLAQMSPPDMRLPILYALSFPERLESSFPALDLAAWGRLEFLPADYRKFPALALGQRVINEGGSSGAVLNAANEVAVDYFLAGRISFPAIWETVTRVLEFSPRCSPADLDTVRSVIAETRCKTVELLEKER